MIKAQVELITPKQATEWLAALNGRIEKGEFINRKVSPRRVERYAADIAAGNWVVTHQGIAFDTKENLVDGQHRLWAVVKANKAVEMLVSRGLPESTRNHKFNVMDAVDSGLNRSIAQQLHVTHGITNSVRVASTCNVIAKLLVDTHIDISLSRTLFVMQMFDRSLEAIINIGPRLLKGPSSILAPMVLYHDAKPKKGKEFAEMYESMENLSQNHPVLKLIKWHGYRPMYTGGSDRYHQSLYCLSCLRFFDAGQLVMDKVYPAKASLDWILDLQSKNAEIMRRQFKLGISLDRITETKTT